MIPGLHQRIVLQHFYSRRWRGDEAAYSSESRRVEQGGKQLDVRQ